MTTNLSPDTTLIGRDALLLSAPTLCHLSPFKFDGTRPSQSDESAFSRPVSSRNVTSGTAISRWREHPLLPGMPLPFCPHRPDHYPHAVRFPPRYRAHAIPCVYINAASKRCGDSEPRIDTRIVNALRRPQLPPWQTGCYPTKPPSTKTSP